MFKEGAGKPKWSDTANFGSGPGYGAKSCPAYAAGFTALGLPVKRRQWGTLDDRSQVQIRPEATGLFDKGISPGALVHARYLAGGLVYSQKKIDEAEEATCPKALATDGTKVDVEECYREFADEEQRCLKWQAGGPKDDPDYYYHAYKELRFVTTFASGA